MPRRLIILRHAKSSWSDGTLGDHARPLNERGRRDAPGIAHGIESRGWQPEQVFCSDAARTRQTWGLMAAVLGDPPVEHLRELYMASRGTVLALLREEAEAQTVAVVSHNPTVHDLVFALTGELDPMTTCNAALLTSTAESWPEALAGRWTLEEVLRPRPPRD